MSTSSSTILSHLSLGEITKLTKLLAYRSPAENFTSAPSSIWLSSQLKILANSALPSSFLRSTSLLSRLRTSLSSKDSTATFCPAHKPLNPHLIHHIFLLVVSEISTRLVRLTTCSNLPPHIELFVKRLRSLNSLWMEPLVYRIMYKVAPEEQRYKRIESNCEACILAFIGGNLTILGDLRASLLGRKKKRHEEPRLLRIVESWLSDFRTERNENVLDESKNLGREVRRLRNRMRQERKEKARRMKEPRADLSRSLDDEEPLLNTFQYQIQKEETRDGKRQGDEADSENDPETAIIDHYASLISNTHLPSSNQDHGHSSTYRSPYGRIDANANLHNNNSNRNLTASYRGVRKSDIHPAFRDSIVFLSETGTFARKQKEREEEVASPLTRISSPRPLSSSRSRPISRRRLESREGELERRHETGYTDSVYSITNSLQPFLGSSSSNSPNLSTTTFSTREDSESQATCYRNLVGINDLGDAEDGDSLSGNYQDVDRKRARERDFRWNGFSGFDGEEERGRYTAETNF